MPDQLAEAIFHAEQYWQMSEPDSDVRDLLVSAAAAVAEPLWEGDWCDRHERPASDATCGGLMRDLRDPADPNYFSLVGGVTDCRIVRNVRVVKGTE